MSKQKSVPKLEPVPKQKSAVAKSDLKKPSRSLKTAKKTALVTRLKAMKAKSRVKVEAEIGARPAKPVVLKLPRALKKAARACAKAQDLKLRAWIVELIKVQVGKESTTSAAKSLQTA